MARKKKDLIYYWENPTPFKEENIQGISTDFKFESPFPEDSSIPINIQETEKEIIVKASVPNHKKNEIDINVTNSSIELTIIKNQEKIHKGKKSIQRERFYNIMKESFSLPNKIDPETANAKIKNGILFIKMKKIDGKKKQKRISIK